MKHPTKDIKCLKSEKLKGKKIVLGITGSIAAVQIVKFARELIRNGAEVQAVMSSWAQDIITPDSVEFATGNPPITELTGKVEHVKILGDRPEKADLYLIYPSTANTISKISNGIDDTPVTTFATTAFPHIPIMIAPAMHESMYEHEIIQENIEKLKEYGVEFVDPNVEEGKAKAVNKEELTHEVIKKLHKNDLKNKNVLVTSGPTKEYIDPVRFISSGSSGKTGITIAEEADQRGAKITFIKGQGSKSPNIMDFQEIEVETTEEMLKAAENTVRENDIDICVFTAAVADFKPQMSEKKIKSGQKIDLKLEPTPKIIEKIREIDSNINIIGYKAEVGVDNEELISKAKKKLDTADMIVANDVSDYGFGTDKNEVYLITKEEVKHLPLKDKKELATDIWDKFIKESLR